MPPTDVPPPDVPTAPDADLAAAARRLVDAFAAGDLDTYFACFAPDATFVFHGTEEVLTSVGAYRDLWARWVAEDGFAVLACTTGEQHWQQEGDAADERESIVFTRRDGRWLAVHEHLSPHPAPAGP